MESSADASHKTTTFVFPVYLKMLGRDVAKTLQKLKMLTLREAGKTLVHGQYQALDGAFLGVPRNTTSLFKPYVHMPMAGAKELNCKDKI